MKKPFPDNNQCRELIKLYKKELANGWSSCVAKKRAGITDRVDRHLSRTFEDYNKTKFDNNLNIKRLNKISYAYLNKRIKEAQERMEKEKKRIEMLESDILPIGKNNSFY